MYLSSLNKNLLIGLFIPYITYSQNYFQQEVNYTIHVKLDDTKHELVADENIQYKNNSPNELSYIYMHLWPNAYKNNATALARQLTDDGETAFYFAHDNLKGYIDQLDFKVDGLKVKWEYDSLHIDICKIYLNEALKSGSTINISTPFHVKIPIGVFSRLGHIQQQYQITQWYPKPAVYDKNGWNQVPYLNQGEFYSEYGAYDVFISLPKNYVLGATGDLIDGEKELEWLNHIADSTSGLEKFNESDAFPKSDTAFKTLHYHQTRVHDFAWFTDKRYHVLKGEVELPHSKRKITTWSMFTGSQAHIWKNSIRYINDAAYYYSLWNGDYPYNQITAVDGALSAGGGMEYPNITVIGESGDAFTLETVIMHEVGHNWFYGILGSNERKHAWMDEGINSFNELRYIRTKYPEEKLIPDSTLYKRLKFLDLYRYKNKTQYELLYLYSAVKNEDQPIELAAEEYTPINYGGIVYSKTAVVFDYLMAYLGEETFDKAMQQYFNTWKFKHPEPNDLKKIIEEVSGKNLNWFFNDLIKSNKKLDYKIVSGKKRDKVYGITIKNTGQIAGPLAVCAMKEGKNIQTIWYEGFEGVKTITDFSAGDYDHFRIDCMERMPEINRSNNISKTRGLFKKTEPLKLQLLGSIDRPDKTQLFITPVLGWNNYNKLMLGMAFYNHTLLQKKFEYTLMPLYGTGNNDIAGYADVNYFIFPDKGVFQSISIGAKATRYAYHTEPLKMNFNKIAPEINFEIRKKNARSFIRQKITLRNVNIIRDYYTTEYWLEYPQYFPTKINTTINELSYSINNSRTINPCSAKLNFQQGDDMAKVFASFNYSLTFKGNAKSLDIRIFSGAFLDNTNAGPYRFRMSGNLGLQDYLYDNIFLARNEYIGNGKLTQQFSETDGAFKLYSPIGQTSNWLTAMNIKLSLPKIPFIRLYGDIGTCHKDGLVNEQILYNAGINLSVIRNVVEIYVPLILSKDLKDNIKLNNFDFVNMIRFSINFNSLNPFYRVKNFNI